MPIIACASNPSPSGFVTPVTSRIPSSTSREYRDRTVASATPTCAAIARNGARPFSCSASMIPRSTSSSERGRVTGPRVVSVTGTARFYRLLRISSNESRLADEIRGLPGAQLHSEQPRDPGDRLRDRAATAAVLLRFFEGEDRGPDHAAAEPAHGLARHACDLALDERQPRPLVVRAG